MSGGEEKLVEQVRGELDRRVEATPAHISSRLNAARHAALESRSRKQSQRWLPAMATAALVAVVVSGTWFSQVQVPEQYGQNGVSVAALGQSAEDFEMLTRNDDFEIYSDMDFYYWLENHSVEAG